MRNRRSAAAVILTWDPSAVTQKEYNKYSSALAKLVHPFGRMDVRRKYGLADGGKEPITTLFNQNIIPISQITDILSKLSDAMSRDGSQTIGAASADEPL